MMSTASSPTLPPTSVRLWFFPPTKQLASSANHGPSLAEKSMKKRQEHQAGGHDHHLFQQQEQDHIEILKAVAQAWHGHSESYKRPTNEFDAYKRNFRGKPTRFKMEAMANPSSSSSSSSNPPSARWDFGQSLWDSYEIVTVSKQLENGLVFDDETFQHSSYQSRAVRKRRESKNSLRNLFSGVSSRRFKETTDNVIVLPESSQ